MNKLSTDLIAYLTALWNVHVPPLGTQRVRALPGLNRAGRRAKKGLRKAAVRVDVLPDGVFYLHPTKGGRFISNRRLGLA